MVQIGTMGLGTAMIFLYEADKTTDDFRHRDDMRNNNDAHSVLK